MEESNEVRVKNEPICYNSQSISQPKEEPKDIEVKTSKSYIESKSEKPKLAYFYIKFKWFFKKKEFNLNFRCSKITIKNIVLKNRSKILKRNCD